MPCKRLIYTNMQGNNQFNIWSCISWIECLIICTFDMIRSVIPCRRPQWYFSIRFLFRAIFFSQYSSFYEILILTYRTSNQNLFVFFLIVAAEELSVCWNLDRVKLYFCSRQGIAYCWTSTITHSVNFNQNRMGRSLVQRVRYLNVKSMKFSLYKSRFKRWTENAFPNSEISEFSDNVHAVCSERSIRYLRSSVMN